MKHFATVGGDNTFEFDIELDDAEARVRHGATTRRARLERLEGDVYLLRVDNRCHEVAIVPHENGYRVTYRGHKYFVEVESEQGRRLRNLFKVESKTRRRAEVRSPMPGLIVAMEVEEGQPVKVGDPLFIMEAMKMENEIRADRNGVVKKILRAVNDSVEKDAVVMLIE